MKYLFAMGAGFFVVLGVESDPAWFGAVPACVLASTDYIVQGAIDRLKG